MVCFAASKTEKQLTGVFAPVKRRKLFPDTHDSFYTFDNCYRTF